MILDNELTSIGRFGKPHGVNGEINISTMVDISMLSCIVLNVEGINVPFFFNTIRPRGVESFLVTIDGINSDIEAAKLVNETVYALRNDIVDSQGDSSDEDGFYADDLLGFKIVSKSNDLDGEIVDIDDSTDNVLFIVRNHDGQQVLIPAVDEFIISIDDTERVIEVLLPDGLVDL